MSPSKSSRQESGWGPWIRFYTLLLLIFFEIAVFVFQNVEKKRLGYELSVLVAQKKQLMATKETLLTDALKGQYPDEIAELVHSSSMELDLYRWPVLRIPNHG
ncbi:MAG: hypothetical protein KC940_19665 [Candidatus Omnitrophica bacterium]|nr:hypothetical protein [Candidatus Omnitrophota bacterium]MCA9434653.1 hypothetical protein [Candidatus Omnitrophota bacterium]MCA9445176.1 hypothetical protein [Candidatus Omnitrophota bacterium]MCB9768559.1 hypothetical protein [Candidatus Omnitrophota bacterium]